MDPSPSLCPVAAHPNFVFLSLVCLLLSRAGLRSEAFGQDPEKRLGRIGSRTRC